MARVHKVEHARNDIPSIGVKKGEPYYWWKTMRGRPKQMSKTPPSRSQTTASAFFSELWSIEDELSALNAGDDLQSGVEGIAQRLRDLSETCRESFENMPEGLQQGSTGQLLEERAEACEAAADELEGVDFEDFDETREEGESDEDFEQRKQDWLEEKLGEVQGVSVECS